MPRGFSNLKPKVGRGDRLKPSDLWKMFDLTKDATQFTEFRFLDTDILPIKTHWIDLITKDGKEVSVPKLCVSFDPDNEDVPMEDTECPYCGVNKGSIAYYANVIVRDIQQDEPRKQPSYTREEDKTGFKDMNSKSWTPVRVIKIPAGLVQKIQGLRERNKHKGKCYDINDPKYGIDVAIKFNKDGTGTDMYQIDRGEKTPLTAEERDYLVYDLGLDAIEKLGRETTEHAKAEFKKMNIVDKEVIDDEDDDDEDDVNTRKRNRKSGSKKRGRRNSRDDDEDDDDEPPFDADEDDEEEDERPSRRRRSSRSSGSSSKRRRSKVDEDDEDDNEDEAPRRNRSSAKKTRSRRSSLDSGTKRRSSKTGASKTSSRRRRRG